MLISIPVTSPHYRYALRKRTLEVTEVTVEVTVKTVCIDIIYSIVTSVTSIFTFISYGFKTYFMVDFRGNRGNSSFIYYYIIFLLSFLAVTSNTINTGNRYVISGNQYPILEVTD